MFNRHCLFLETAAPALYCPKTAMLAWAVAAVVLTDKAPTLPHVDYRPRALARASHAHKNALAATLSCRFRSLRAGGGWQLQWPWTSLTRVVLVRVLVRVRFQERKGPWHPRQRHLAPCHSTTMHHQTPADCAAAAAACFLRIIPPSFFSSMKTPVQQNS